MSRSVNKIILVGNVGQDPDVQETGNGTKVAHFSLATNRRTNGSGEEPQERADWHRLTVWNRLAQFAEDYVSKGDVSLGLLNVALAMCSEPRLAFDPVALVTRLAPLIQHPSR